MTIQFIHIPKTAGTSLNSAAEHLFGAAAVLKDYGPTEPHTSELIKHHIYGERGADQFALLDDLRGKDIQWLAGHVNMDRYTHILGCQNSISFVRDPVERVISEYQYRRRTQDMEVPFEDFYRSKDETNKQFRMIGQYPWQALHFIGSQEAYAECIDFLATSFGIPLLQQSENVSRAEEKEPVSADTRADILKWNERDAIFVAEVKAYLDKHLEASRNKQDFCYHDVGFQIDTHLIGWAFLSGEPDAQEIELYIDGTLREAVLANEYRNDLHTFGAPRMGHCGFRFVLAPYTDTQTVELRHAGTGQTLFSWSR